MPPLRAQRLLNAVEIGSVSGAQLETTLADPGRLADWQVLASQRGQTRRMAAATTTMTALVASPRAMGVIVRSNYAMLAMTAKAEAWNAIVNSSAAFGAVTAYPAALAVVSSSPSAMAGMAASATARGAVVASSTIMATLLEHAVARQSFYDTDAWLTAIAGSAVAKAAMRACPTYLLIDQTTYTAGAARTINGITGPSLLVGWSTDGSGTYNITMTGRRAGSSVGSLTASDAAITGTTGQYDNVMAITSPATVTATSTSAVTHYFGTVPV